MRKSRALRTIRKLKAQTEAELSGWEGEFLDSVETRIGTYGRAFADPEKGDRESAVSILQARKLKEIAAKAAGDAPGHKTPLRRTATPKVAKPGQPLKPGKGFARRKPFGNRKDTK